LVILLSGDERLVLNSLGWQTRYRVYYFMMNNTKHIRIGFFDNLKGEDSILISVDIHGLLEMEDIFVKLSNGLESYNFSKLKLLDKKHKIEIIAFNESRDIGLKRIEKNKYEWRLTKNKWNEFREKLTAMYRVEKVCHQYLDSDSVDNLDFQVIISLNEYALDWWKQYFKATNERV